MVNELIAALISLIIGTLLGSELTRFLYRPRVIIRYKDTSPLFTPDGVHWSIKVANIGRTVASNCKGVIFISDISTDDLINAEDADPQEILPNYSDEEADLSFPRHQQLDKNFFRPIDGDRIAWATLGNPDTIDINPGITELIDVCKIQFYDKGNYIIFPTSKGWRRIAARVKAKNITGKIMICPSNEFPTVIRFRLTFDDRNRSEFTAIKPRTFDRLQRVLFRRKYFFG